MSIEWLGYYVVSGILGGASYVVYAKMWTNQAATVQRLFLGGIIGFLAWTGLVSISQAETPYALGLIWLAGTSAPAILSKLFGKKNGDNQSSPNIPLQAGGVQNIPK